eukprot:2743434-Rhodomonas_salina.1
MHSLVVTEVKMLPGDGNGLVTKHRSCLKALVAQSYTPPLSYTDMQAELSNKSFGVPEDQAVCMVAFRSCPTHFRRGVRY